jgi:integrase
MEIAVSEDQYSHYEEVIRLPQFQAILYTKKESRKKTWQCRIKPRNSPAIIKSTKTTSIPDAVAFAMEQYHLVSAAERAGISPRINLTFEKVWESFINAESTKASLSDYRAKTLTKIIEKYYVQYFGSVSIRSITTAAYESYKDWRRGYWTSGPGVAELVINPNKRHSKEPAYSTLQYEHAGFVQIRNWASRRYGITNLPPLSGFARPRFVKKTRGGGIEPIEWMNILKTLRERAYEPKGRDGNPVKLNRAHSHERKVLYYLVHFMGGSMLRPSEAYRLKWRNLRWKDSTENISAQDLLIEVSAEVSKTKVERIAVGTNVVAEKMRQWKSETEFSDKDDFVFPRAGGQRLQSANTSFKKVLAELGITQDSKGVRITLYSCRHRGITAALYREIPILDVAIYAGTSVAHIQNNYYKADMVKKSSAFALQRAFKAKD